VFEVYDSHANYKLLVSAIVGLKGLFNHNPQTAVELSLARELQFSLTGIKNETQAVFKVKPSRKQ